MDKPFLSQLENSLQDQLDKSPEQVLSMVFDGPDISEWIAAYLRTHGYPELKELRVLNGRYSVTFKGRD